MSYLEETCRLIEGLHGVVVNSQVACIGICDDHLQGGWVHVPQVNMTLFTLRQTTHKHGPEEENRTELLSDRPIRLWSKVVHNVGNRMLFVPLQ